MNFRIVFRVIGQITIFYGLCMLLPLIITLIYGENGVLTFSLSSLATLLTGASMVLLFRKGSKEIYNREGFFIVGMVWLLMGFFGSLPYFINHVFPTYTDCIFEAVSGLTTTGASVMTTIEDKSHGILFWRALTHWIGGMGIILMALAVLPLLGVGGMQLYRAEVPGPDTDKLKPRISETAKILWVVYVFLTVAEVFLLMLGGMNWFDAICHSFATVATGGFSTKNLSIESYHSAYIDYVVAIFMVLAGINFALHYKFVRGNRSAYSRDPEFRFFIGVFGVIVIIFTCALYFNGIYDSVSDSFRYGFFQVATIMTCTGFSTANFDLWPSLLRFLLLLLMFVGAMTGSTGGGLKTMRVMLVMKAVYYEFYRMIHPHAVVPIRLGKTIVSDPIMRSVIIYFIAYLSLFTICSIFMTALGYDIIVSTSAVASTLGGVGPGLGIVGPYGNYADIHIVGKWILCLCMYAGRLEIYTLMLILLPNYWRK